jgi:hypothetical protein
MLRARTSVTLALLIGACSGHGKGSGPAPGPAADAAGAPPADAGAPPADGPPEPDAGAMPDGPPPSLPDAGMISPPPPVEPADVPLPACKRTVPVADAAALATALGGAQAGDCLELADGAYTFPSLNLKGTAEAPIVVKAAHPLAVTVMTGDLNVTGAYVVVSGLTWPGAGVVKISNCDHCRLTRSRLQRDDTNGGEWVTITGTSKYCRIDHNDFGPQNHGGNMIQLSGSGAQIVQWNRIDHNLFHDVHFSGANGWESIRAGLSGWTYSSAHNLIEFNLFLRDNNDPEAVSLKSSDNVLRYNTMRASVAQFSLRHGYRTLVYGNHVLGDGVAKTQGIRVCGGDHRLFNNYVQGVDSPGIMLEGGDGTETMGMLTDHKQVFRTEVVFNTIVNNRGIDVGGGHQFKPIDCTVGYNLLQGSGPLISEAAGTVGTRYFGNMVNGPSTVTTGVMMVDPKLMKVGDVFAIAAGSPAIDAAGAGIPYVTDDIDGRPRDKPDVGADEVSSQMARWGLLGEADVGPMAP